MKRLLFIFFSLIAITAMARDLKVKVSTESVTDSAATGTRAVEGEKPVQPLNINIGTQKLSLFGYAQMHYDFTSQDGHRTNDFNIRRVILMASAQLFNKLSIFLMVDAASTVAHKHLQEFYAQYDFLPQLKVRIGQFKQPFMLENLLSPSLLGTLNMNESTRYFAAIAGDPLMGNIAGRDLGLMVSGDAVTAADGHALLNYSAGIFNGSGLNFRDNNSQKDFIAMLNVVPVKGLTLSTSCLLGTGHAVGTDAYGNVQEGDNYRRQRWSAGLEAKMGRWMLRSEFAWGRNRDIKSLGAYAEVWFRVLPKLDIVADVDYLNRNTALSRDEQAALGTYTQTTNFLVGLQYWVYKKCRVASQYIFNNRRTGPDAHQWVTQVQVAF